MSLDYALINWVSLSSLNYDMANPQAKLNIYNPGLVQISFLKNLQDKLVLKFEVKNPRALWGALWLSAVSRVPHYNKMSTYISTVSCRQ